MLSYLDDPYPAVGQPKGENAIGGYGATDRVTRDDCGASVGPGRDEVAAGGGLRGSSGDLRVLGDASVDTRYRLDGGGEFLRPLRDELVAAAMEARNTRIAEL
jgi:hypothetical protein